MKRLLIYILIVGFIVFIVLQFFQPEKNVQETTESHIFTHEIIPDDVKEILRSSCMDCHSNKTVYLWYDNIAPASWMVSKHIVKGKKELNFSAWSEQDAFDKYGAFKDIQKEVEKKNMPLKSYTVMHRKARLSDEQRKALVDWCRKRIDELSEELR